MSKVRLLFFSSLLAVAFLLTGSPSFANEPPKSIKIYFLSGFIYDWVHNAANLVEEETKLQAARLNIPVTFSLRWCSHWRAVAKEIAALKNDEAVVLVGHSWGGSAAVEIAHRLNKQKRPVELLITIDSVPIPGSFKTWKIPPNVGLCCNYYQTRDVWRSYKKGHRYLGKNDPKDSKDSTDPKDTKDTKDTKVAKDAKEVIVPNDPNVQNIKVEMPMRPSPIPHVQIAGKVAPVISFQIGQLMLGKLDQIRMPETLDQATIDKTKETMKVYLTKE